MNDSKPWNAPSRTVARVASCLCVFFLCACGPPQGEAGMDAGEAGDTEAQEFAFTGTVQQIDTVTSIVTVENDDIPGWMMSMTMAYTIDPPEVLRSLEPGDRITAKVYSGDFGKLYEVEVAPRQ